MKARFILASAVLALSLASCSSGATPEKAKQASALLSDATNEVGRTLQKLHALDAANDLAGYNALWASLSGGAGLQAPVLIAVGNVNKLYGGDASIEPAGVRKWLDLMTGKLQTDAARFHGCASITVCQDPITEDLNSARSYVSDVQAGK